MPKKIVHPASLRALIRRDSRFAEMLKRYGPPPDWHRNPGFPTLCQIIIEQQVSLESAAACYGKLAKRIQPLTPANLLQQDEKSLRACDLSRQKMRYLRVLAEAVNSQRLVLSQLGRLPVAEARERLTSVTGIGNWTAEIYMIFCLRHTDIFPLGDVAAVRVVRELWSCDDLAEVEEQTLRWTPYRTLATYCCWHYYLKQRGRQAPYDA